MMGTGSGVRNGTVVGIGIGARVGVVDAGLASRVVAVSWSLAELAAVAPSVGDGGRVSVEVTSVAALPQAEIESATKRVAVKTKMRVGCGRRNAEFELDVPDARLRLLMCWSAVSKALSAP